MIEIRAIAVGLLMGLIFAGTAGLGLAQTPSVQQLDGNTTDLDKYSTGTTSTTQDLLSGQSEATTQMQILAAAPPGECIYLTAEESASQGLENTNIVLRVGLDLASIDENVASLRIVCHVCREPCDATEEEIPTSHGSYPTTKSYFVTNSAAYGEAYCSAGELLWPTSGEIPIFRLASDTSPLQSIKYYHCRLNLSKDGELDTSPGRDTRLTPPWAWAKEGTELVNVLQGEIGQ
jgi:hypothetical protein